MWFCGARVRDDFSKRKGSPGKVGLGVVSHHVKKIRQRYAGGEGKEEGP